MNSNARLTDSLIEFARNLTGRFDVSNVLHDLAARAPTAIGVAGAGVSLWSGTELSFETSSSELVDTVERVQEETQDGPCMEAIRTGENVLISDIREQAHRWPKYVAAAEAAGILSVAAMPLRNAVKLGAIDLYDTKVRTWESHDVSTARVFSDIATGYVLSSSDLERERRTVEQLQLALESRVVIEQAKGFLANANDVSIDVAFSRLRKYARDHNANLRDVATAVVTLGLRM
jgi:hypothetical protein